MSYVDDIARDGFAILPQFLDSETISRVLEALSLAKLDDGASQRAGKAFGIRNLFNVVPFTRDLANSPACRSLVEPILGFNARVVRGIYFDKHKDANWKVAWHQDLTIAVCERVDSDGYGPLDGYGPWSLKAGIHHVQPPVSVLENMLTLRIHLDHTDESNGALIVLPGTHAHGRLAPSQISHFKHHIHPITCTVPVGGALLMRPLLLHSSTTAITPHHRRVLHFEYSLIALPSGLRWFEETAHLQHA
ncbi:MAG TPA: phytanoyl-CoA dioxygenase family protein [Pyrinomonadaceae bacterium]|nr:phytanoyl-CoA dioxygenase family protein [Pyrinomonadaceae bacterium]